VPSDVALPSELVDATGRPFRIRRLEAGDRPGLEAMYADFEPLRIAQGLPPATPETQRAWLDEVLAEGLHLAVTEGPELVGHGMLMPYGDAVELANFLHQRVRGRGIGTALNRALVDLARREGYDRVWLSVEPSNRAAIRSYEKAGFRFLPGSVWGPEIEMEVDLRADER